MLLRAANIASRIAALVAAGLFTFVLPGRGQPAPGPLQVVAYIEAAVLTVAWLTADIFTGDEPWKDRLLPWVQLAIGVPTAVAATASPVTGGNLLILTVVAAIIAGTRTSLVTGWLITGPATVASIVTGVAAGTSWWVTVEFATLILVGFMLGLNRRTYRLRAEQASALLAQTEQLRTEQTQVATLDERARIAREIHDVLAHSLGALGVQIQVAKAVLTDQSDIDRAVELLDQAHRMATEGLSETRRAVHALRGDMLPLPEGLAELTADHRRRHGTPVTLDVDGQPRPLSPDAQLAMARTAQEALVNTVKHAPRQPVRIRLDYTGEDRTSLSVSNHLAANGQAAPGPALATVNGRYGLAGLRERLLLLDGTLRAGRSGADWVVVAEVPQ